MSGCARHGMKQKRCSGRCQMTRSRLSHVAPTRKIRQPRDTDRGWKRASDEPIPLPRGRELVTLEEARSWLLATIFRRDSAGFGAINTSRGSQRLTRRLYPTEGVMRSKHKEYRQLNHRPSCEHGNPVRHRDIVRRIRTQDARYRRDMPVVVPSREWPPLLTGPGIPMQVVVPSVS